MNGFVGRWLKLSIVALVGCGFVGLMVYALLMKDEILNAQVEPPLIAAPEEAAKRRPEEPGGMEIPNQDKLVFDLLEHPSPTDLTSSQPLASAVDVTPTVEIQAVEISPQSGQPVDETVLAGPAPIAPAQEVEPAAAPAETVVEKVAPKVEEPKVEAKPEPAKARGGWGVQLASVGSSADAKRAAEKFASVAALKGLNSRISEVQVKGKTYYRVQFAGLESREAAVKVCSKMGKQACLPVDIK